MSEEIDLGVVRIPDPSPGPGFSSSLRRNGNDPFDTLPIGQHGKVQLLMHHCMP